MKIAIITGASSGMGACFAKQIDKSFTSIDEIWLIARNTDKLRDLSKKLLHKTKVFSCDITRSEELIKIEDDIKANKCKIALLVNSAGYGIIGDFIDKELESQTGMIDLNCKALTEITHRFIPYMCKHGRIIQMASSAAFAPQSNFAVYAASKAYVYSFSRALNRELRDKKIHVTAVCPGPVDTPFFDIAEQGDNILSIKKYVMANPEKVVKKAIKDSYKRKDTSVYGLPIKAFNIVSKIIPHTIILDCVELMNKKKES